MVKQEFTISAATGLTDKGFDIINTMWQIDVALCFKGILATISDPYIEVDIFTGAVHIRQRWRRSGQLQIRLTNVIGATIAQEPDLMQR